MFDTEKMSTTTTAGQLDVEKQKRRRLVLPNNPFSEPKLYFQKWLIKYAT